MHTHFDEVELGLVVNLETLRAVLKGLSADGKRWWIASDPYDAAVTGYVSIGHGHPSCNDRLNTLYFRIPVLSDATLGGRTNRIVLLLDPAVLTSESAGYYVENGRIVQDGLEDFASFYHPVKHALLARLQSGD